MVLNIGSMRDVNVNECNGRKNVCKTVEGQAINEVIVQIQTDLTVGGSSEAVDWASTEFC